jgi:hypothetical protein
VLEDEERHRLREQHLDQGERADVGDAGQGKGQEPELGRGRAHEACEQ